VTCFFSAGSIKLRVLRVLLLANITFCFSVLLSKRMNFVNLIQASGPMHRVLFSVVGFSALGLTIVADMEKTTSS
jgi:hypothetical protein